MCIRDSVHLHHLFLFGGVGLQQAPADAKAHVVDEDVDALPCQLRAQAVAVRPVGKVGGQDAAHLSLIHISLTQKRAAEHFLRVLATKYAEELVKKMKASGAKAYLVNTGWNGTGTVSDTHLEVYKRQERLGAVVVIGVDHRKGAVDEVLGGQHGVAGAPGLDRCV